MNGALLTALERIEREKGIEKEILFEAIESALASAARKVIDDPDIDKEDITATVDRETGEIAIFSEGEEVESERFGRIAAQTAKQVMIQKIREAERDVIFEKYSKQVGSIISGSVHRFDKGNVIVELNDTEAVLPKSEQIPRERFRQGENVRAYLIRVERGSSGSALILSRANAGFVRKLFELEVPEIFQGIVEIKALSREPGERTKIAVCSKEEKVDPVGACVGMRGSRVRDIVKELNGERIDIVRWYSDIREYLPAAVSPAEISRIAIDRDNKIIKLTVPKDQLALLIGKKGRNIRLASKLLDWELMAESEEQTQAISLEEVPGIGKKTREVFEAAGYDSAQKVYKAGVEKLKELKGVGTKTAEKIFAACIETLKASEFGLPEDEEPKGKESAEGKKTLPEEEIESKESLEGEEENKPEEGDTEEEKTEE